jgi:hypothetical protein
MRPLATSENRIGLAPMRRFGEAIMTLHLPRMRAPRWMAHAHVNRAMTIVLGVIGVSLLFSAVRVLDVAVSGALTSGATHVIAIAPAASGAPMAPDRLIGTEPTSAGAPADASVVDVPAATVEAISL